MRFVQCLGVLLVTVAAPVHAQATPPEILFRNVRVFDGATPQLSDPTDVLVRGNLISRIAPGQTAPDARLVDGRGRTLMPGLIDVHVHMTFTSMPMTRLLAPDLTPAAAEAAAAAEDGAS